MKKKTHSIVFAVVILGILLIVAVAQYGIQNTRTEREKKIHYESANIELSEKTISIGKATLQVELAQTPEERRVGLSHRRSLQKGRGMLFLFKKEGNYSFWMKDMYFPIDIIWINADKKIVHIEHRVAPETYPKSFASPIPAQYVLEVPAGYIQNRIMTGDMLLIK